MKALLGALAALLVALAANAKPEHAGVFVVGIDGMDPVILERMMARGEMPNFARLRDEGTFQPLGTSTPPQSPVAWSNFVTGMNPGGHGIFDFIHRNPATYMPISSATPPVEDPGGAVHAFGYVFPTSSPQVRNNRGGTPWWDVLEKHGVDVEVYRIPGNFPTPPSKAHVLGGMGTVDVRGGYGTYTLYTDHPLPADDKPKGDVQLVRVQDLDLDGTPDTVNAILRGPPDQFHLEPGALPRDDQYLAKGVTIHLSADRAAAVVEIGDQRALLRQGEWSDWIAVDYDALPMGLVSVAGSVRFYAKQLSPGFQVYASPVNISPASPAVPLTSPDAFIDDLFTNLGFFYTKGMPEETEALKDGVFDDDDYLAQVALVQQDTRRMIDLALDRFAPGDATFVYLSDIDLQCHMLWRHADPKDPGAPHPARDAAVAARHAHDIERFYTDVDRELGAIRKRLPAETMLLVMSDHGFQPYTRKLHLNAWLRDNGYLALRDGKHVGQISAGDVDWSHTRAYGLGFNGLYLNLVGREGQGIVAPGEAAALAEGLREKLLVLRDPKSGQRVVVRVDRSQDVYSPERRGEGPDLIVGYDRGYGASDESTLGEITDVVFADNTSRWSGNHLMAPEVVPGILLTNRKLSGSDYNLVDVTATLLAYYGIDPVPGMVGHAIH
jgi:predicted AlkP superfamily phosphohydrolase/phosphomutase